MGNEGGGGGGMEEERKEGGGKGIAYVRDNLKVLGDHRVAFE